METPPEKLAIAAGGHVAEKCAHCGSTATNRLFLRECDALQCEACLLDRCLQPHDATLTIDGLYGRFVEALTETLDIRERETGLHSRRAACHTLVLARHWVTDPTYLRQIYWGALLHDIGKIGIPDHILLKQEGLDEEEWAQMRTHVELGYHIVSLLPDLAIASALVRCHEERHDGTGYPRGLRGEEIPLGARLFAVIDTLDAMTSDRSYRKALPFDQARQEIVRMSGTQFSPEAVEIFVAEEAALRQMVEMKCNAVRLA
jgi:HD-GYP domain-containing protein (c-di-GMP phosphodiesterase class II)